MPVNWVKARMPVRQGVFFTHGEEAGLNGLEQGLSGELPPDRIVIPQIDDAFELSLHGFRPVELNVRRRLQPERVGRLDWHNDLSRLLLDITQSVNAAAEEAGAPRPSVGSDAHWARMKLRIVSATVRGRPTLLFAQTAVPTSTPIPAVSAIAKAPQKVTRSVAIMTFAPPAFAPIAPRNARNSSEAADTTQTSEAAGATSTIAKASRLRAQMSLPMSRLPGSAAP